MTTTNSVTAAAIVERTVGSTMSGCKGVAAYRINGATAQHGIVPERLLGRLLGEGTILEVTIRVVHEEPMPTECINPWSGHAGREGGTVMRHCIGHPEHEA